MYLKLVLLDELLPNWRELNSPIKTKVTKEKFLFLGKTKSLSWPTWLLPARFNKIIKIILLV